MKQIRKNLIITLIVVFLFLIMGSVIAESSVGEQLTDAFTILDIAPKDFVYEQPAEISKEAAEQALKQAEDDIFEMDAFNFVNVLPKDALTEAKQAYEQEDYEQVLKLTQLIAHLKTEKIEFYDRVKLLEVKKQALLDKGVQDLFEVNDLTQQAMNYFNLEQLDNAKEMLREADDKAEELNSEYRRVKLITTLTQNVLVRYWWQILLVLVVIGVSSPLIYRRIRKGFLKRKIARLNLEQSKTKGLIKNLQKECFIDKNITTDSYKERAAKYEDRISEIKRVLPVFEAQLKGVSTNKFRLLLNRVMKRKNNQVKQKKVTKKTKVKKSSTKTKKKSRNKNKNKK